MPWVEGQGGVPDVPNKEPGWHYRWLADDHERLSQHTTGHGDAPGYRIVGAGLPVVKVRELATALGFSETFVDDFGRIRWGHLILGQIPLSEATRRVAVKKKDMDERLQGAEEDYHRAASGRGVRSFKRELGDIEDRREFARRDGGGRAAVPSNFEGSS